MTGSKAALRYAKAVYQQARETGAEADIFEDMKTVHASIEGSRELQLVLKSPIIKNKDKKGALLKIFKNQSKATQSLIHVLIANQRPELLGEVAKSYVQLHNEATGVKAAKVITAVPLSETLEKKVLSKVKELTGSDSVTLENEVDESIIGGFILRMGDLQYNASIANKLENLKREFGRTS